MDRYWLLTNTCYGNRLPGDERGFVGRVWDHRRDDPQDQPRVIHNIPGTPVDEDIPGLQEQSRAMMKGPPIHLTTPQSASLLAQFQETAHFRGWELVAVAIMFNHFHIVVGVSGDPEPSKILGDFKSWATRTLIRLFGAPRSKTWWTERGSKRKLSDENSINEAGQYVLYRQPEPLVTWSIETGANLGYPPRASVEA